MSAPAHYPGRLTGLLLALVTTAAACSEAPRLDPHRRAPAREINEVATREPQAGDALAYVVRLSDRQHQYLDIEATFPAEKNSEVVLLMSVWTPGSYLVREYARNVEDLEAVSATGSVLPVRKIRKNRWAVTTDDGTQVTVRYRVYARELSVRTNFVDDDLAIINGAPTFVTLEGAMGRAHDVRIELPEGWRGPITALDPHPDGLDHHFRASNFDELVDSPIVAGAELVTSEFEVEGIRHRLTHLGDTTHWDLERATREVQLLSRGHARLWNIIPYEHYDFINGIVGSGGGLEHLDSTLILSGPFSTKTDKNRKRWLGLVSHELFHAWNVKRLRPAALGPFDYENEVYTDSLWIAEGITSYYGPLLLRRTGLISEDDYLEALSQQIRTLQTTPGRTVQPLSQSSFDSWIKHYRPDENSNNTAVSYYTKGAVVAFLLDARLRQLTDGRRTLDDLMRVLYERYSGERGYTTAEFRATASEIAGQSLDDFFAHTVDGKSELDYEPALEYFGLELDVPASGTSRDDAKQSAWLGAELADDRVTKVTRDTPAYRAGLNVDDEILAVDGYRGSSGLASLLESFAPGEEVALTIARRGRLRELRATLGEAPSEAWKLSRDRQRSQTQRLRYDAWLAPELAE